MSTTDPNPPVDTAQNGSSFSEGQRLAGCYVLSSRLPLEEGREVWLAVDEVLGKDVSLHFLPTTVFKDRKLLQELRAEIKRNRQLVHKNVLRVYDLIDEPEWSAISMDTVDGASAAALLAKMGRGFDIEDVQPWVAVFGQTLEDAHRLNILHRDLAPENLFLTSASKLLLANFGLSRAISDALVRAGAKESRHAAYSSPQILDGQAATKADDIYSFGAVLYALLTGQAPFVGSDVPQLVRLGATPETLATLRRSELGVPVTWIKAIAACLEKSPEARPASIADLLKIISGEISPTIPAFEAALLAPIEAKTAPIEAKVAPVLEKAPEPAEVPPKFEEKADEIPQEPVSGELKLAAPVEIPVVEEKSPEPAPVEPIVSEEEGTPKLEEAVAPKVEESAAPLSEAVPLVIPPVEEKSPVVEEKPLVIEEPVAEIAKPVEAKTPLFEPIFEKEEPEPVVEKLIPAEKEAPVEDQKSGVAEPVEEKADKIVPVDAEAKKQALEAATLDAFKKERQMSGSFTNPSRTSTPAPRKTPDRGPQQPTEFAPLRYPKEPSFPVIPVGVAAALVVVAAIVYHFVGGDKPKPEPTLTGEPEHAELRNLTTPAANPPVVTSSSPAPTLPTATDTSKPPSSPDGAAIAEKQAALEKAQAAAEASSKAHADWVKQKQLAEAALADTQKTIDEKARAAEPLQKASDDVIAQKKKLEGDQKAAEQAAQEAQKAAADKTRAAEEAKKSLAALVAKSQDTLAAREKADAELEALRKTLADKQSAAAGVTKSAESSETEHQQQLAAIAQITQELERAKSGSPAVKTSADPLHSGQLEEEMAAIRKRAAQLGSPQTGTTPAPATTSGKSTPAPSAIASTPAATPDAAKLALLSTPAPTVSATPTPAAAANGAPNSLGMKFVPVGDVEFAIYEVRVKDFEAFAKVTPNLKSTSWKSPGFKQGPDHPVVNVTWQEAIAFCQWLTDKEHKEGVLPANQFYRLPTDMEWSTGVGLPPETGKTAEDRDMGVPGVYPWGTAWPPPQGAGNYTGEETSSDVAIKGYDDGFAWTSPVGSFSPNKLGLYDMGGNVWQWCMDNWNNESKAKVLRGASWYNGALKLSLLSSCRVHAAPDSSTDNYGFRIVRATTPGSKPPKK